MAFLLCNRPCQNRRVSALSAAEGGYAERGAGLPGTSVEVPAPNPRGPEQGGRDRLEIWGTWAVLGCEVPERWPLYPQPAKQGVTGVLDEWPAASPSTPGEWLLPQGTLWGQESGPNTRGTSALRRG